MTPLEALQEAVKILGNKRRLGDACLVKDPQVSKWLKRGRAPAHRVLQIEKATKGCVKRWELRPDMYPPKDYRKRKTLVEVLEPEIKEDAQISTEEI